MPQNRVYFAVQQVGLKTEGVDLDVGPYTEVHGAQSVSMTTNFNLEQIFELGQLSIYENVETLPDVEVTMNKVLDGYATPYMLATKSALTPTLAGRSNARSILAIAIFDDTLESATGTPISQVATSGMFVSSLSYNFPLDGNFSEDVTFVGNNKVWKDDSKMEVAEPSWASTVFAGAFDGNDSPASSPSNGGVNRREDILFDVSPFTIGGLDDNGMVNDPVRTILPPDIIGVSPSGTHDLSDEDRARLADITVSVDLGRENINELGRRGPYHRFVTFPVEVSTEVNVTTTSGDFVSALEDGILAPGGGLCPSSDNLTDRTIRVVACEGIVLYMGLKNKLSSVSYSGGDAGGGNVTVTYSFTTFNDLTVMHGADPNTNFDMGDSQDRQDYLTN